MTEKKKAWLILVIFFIVSSFITIYNLNNWKAGRQHVRETDNLMKDQYIKLPGPYIGEGFGNDVTIMTVNDKGEKSEIMPLVEKIGYDQSQIVFQSQSVAKENPKYFGVIYIKSGLKYDYHTWETLRKKHPSVKDIKLKFVYKLKTYDSLPE